MHQSNRVNWPRSALWLWSPAIVVREQNPALHGPRQACGRLLMPEFWLFLGKKRADTFSDILCLKNLIAQRQRLLDGIGFIRIEKEINCLFAQL